MEEVSTLVKPASVAAVSLDNEGLGEAEADGFFGQVADETRPPDDPVRGSAAPIFEAVLKVSKTKVVGF